MAKKIKIGKKHFALIITAMVFFVISVLHFLGVFNYLEYKSYDLRVRLMAEYTRPSDEIIVILLTQDCLDWAQKERGWGWPWPRQAYAEIVDYMNLGGAKAIAFDVIFSEPSIYRNAKQDEIIDNAVNYLENAASAVPERRRSNDVQTRVSRQTARFVINALQSLSAREDDTAFAKAMNDYGKVVQAVFFSSQTGSARSWPAEIEKPLFQTENFSSFLNRFDIADEYENTAGAQFPIKELTDASAALGCVTGSPDSDGIIRRIKPFTLFDGKTVPGLSAAMLMVSGTGQTIRYNEKNSALEWEGFTIPVDKNGNALLRYRGELDRYIPYRASDILKSAQDFKDGNEPLLTPENFTDCFAFFGFYATGLFDIFSTPISSLYPGMGCHITMLDNILQGDFIRESTLPVNLIILFLIVTAVVLLTLFSRRIYLSVGGIIFLTVIIIAVSFGAYNWSGLWLPMVTFIAGILASFITATLYNYATEGSQKRFIKSAFSQYLSPKVIDQIIQDPSQLKLGGEKREMTAIFTDVRAFSTISEALGDPAKLVELLNFYLTRMSDIVLENQGTIDKYEGDAIIAFFGAPVHMDNHASLACRAAVMMKRAEMEVNRDALNGGLITRKVMEALAAKGATKSVDDPFPLFTRLGINTGDMVVGNMGTPNKMDYTIMGNAVNLAARLEGVNKQYDTGGILISEYTRQHIGDEFIIRPLSRVRVVGINTPLRLYELLDIADSAQAELISTVKEWETAFNLYEKRDFHGARDIFQAIYGKNSSDMAAKKYLDRCAKYIDTPPDEKKWDNGVDNLTEK
ncbi:MAG: adenylate/guanylate cyclase domain-containing protein [Treponema sp.]|jgi:class 3 adenylate cyclase/CHASE2 domain-containing sensor protein|nr:adenylate/guanylate cyclase domain-containing protein [Treponema sp.]